MLKIFCIYFIIIDSATFDSTIIIKKTWSNVAFVSTLICSILGTIVNMLTIMVILSQKIIREMSVAALLFCLGICDLMLSIIVLPLQAIRFYNQEFPFPEHFCAYWIYFHWILVVLSVLILAMLGLNRAIGKLQTLENISIKWKSFFLFIVNSDHLKTKMMARQASIIRLETGMTKRVVMIIISYTILYLPCKF